MSWFDIFKLIFKYWSVLLASLIIWLESLIKNGFKNPSLLDNPYWFGLALNKLLILYLCESMIHSLKTSHGGIREILHHPFHLTGV